MRERALANAQAGFAYDEELGNFGQILWIHWSHHASSFSDPLAPGLLATVRVLTGEGTAPEDYCFLAHATAGFFTARSTHMAYAASVGRAGDERVEMPQEVLREMRDMFVKSVMLFGHNRLLDVAKVAGWAVGAGEILEALDAQLRTCPTAEGATPCTVGKLEAAFLGSLAQFAGPLRPSPAGLRALGAEPGGRWPSGAGRAPAPGGCRARRAAGGAACEVRAWYLGTHESLFREVETMWNLLSDEFVFIFFRLNPPGYNPGELPAESASSEDRGSRSGLFSAEKRLSFRVVGEAILDVQPASRRLHWMLPREAKRDAELLLCTIPAFACSAFADLPLPVVMYAANPLTAQVPFMQYDAWLTQFADLAADPKNQLLVSNPWSQAQFEYQAGISLPVIRSHGLYTNAKHDPDATGPHSSEVLVYDRTSPLLARVLQALLKNEGTGRSSLPSQFVHHGSTDREFKTFASFAAVVFLPGDVEQMAFYEFYSMGLPVFVPADPGRYMWPRLPGFKSVLDEPCGPYAALAGTWELRYVGGHYEALAFDCAGHTELVDGGGVGAGNLQPLARMDELGFSHCVVLGRRGNRLQARRFRLNGDSLQAVYLEGDTPCEGFFAEASGNEDMEQGMAATSVTGTRRPGGPEPAQPSQWDHDIFASTAWFLEARLGGPSRAEHSPFNLGSIAAAREWAAVMDYFRFPAVGLFVSAAELMATLAAGGRGGLGAASREMHAFNDVGLRHSLRQWRAVLSYAVP